jgi:hypothetical protein
MSFRLLEQAAMLRKRRPNRAFALIMALIFVFILLTLALGLISSEQGAGIQQLAVVRRFVASRLGHEAEAALLLAERGTPLAYNSLKLQGVDTIGLRNFPQASGRFSWASGLGRDSRLARVPSSLASSANIFNTKALNPYGAFGYADENRQTVWGDASVPAWTSAGRLQTPGDRDYCLSVGPGWPYAVYAPAGQVYIQGDVFGWSNPTIEETTKQKLPPMDNRFRSGVPVNVAAQRTVRVDGNYEHGRAYSATREVSLARGSRAIAMSGRNTNPHAIAQLFDQIDGSDGVVNKLRNCAVDKSDFIIGRVLDVSGFMDLIRGKREIGAIFSLQQACSFPWIPIPEIQEDELWTVVGFSVPYPPNLAAGNWANWDYAKKLIGDMINLKNAWKAAKQVLKDAERVLEDAGKVLDDLLNSLIDVLEGDIDKAKADVKKAQDAVDDAEQAVEDAWNNIINGIFGPLKQILDDIISAIQTKPPETRYQEEKFSTTGFAYYELIKKFFVDGTKDAITTIIDLIKGKNIEDDLDNLFNDIAQEIRLVHFCDRGPTGKLDGEVSKAQFPTSGGFTMCATWNVPRGRTMKWRDSKAGSGATFIVKGDLWIMRGATLVVEGNLKLQKPSPAEWAYRASADVPPEEDDPFFPSGRIFLEEGATLVVTGDLEAEGDRNLGTVVVGSKLNSEHPITSAVFCRGNMTLKHGTGSGVPLDEFLYYYADMQSTVKKLYDGVIDPLFEDIGTMVARIVGPFHTRECWFASFQTTFVIIPELIEIGAQGPWPIPLPYENCARKMFDPFSKVYKYELNAVLGPNLLTHCDWWLFGYGQVPFMPKVPSLLEQSSVFGSLGSDWEEMTRSIAEEILKSFVKDVLPAIAKDLITTTVTTIVSNLIGEGMNAKCLGGSSEGGGESAGKKAESDILDKILEKTIEKVKIELKDMALNVAKLVRNKVYEEIGKDVRSQTLTQELPGVLLYAGGNMRIGDGGEPGPMVAGMVLAKGSIEIQSEQTIGVVCSLNGDVTTRNFAYYPYWTSASIYVPQNLGASSSVPGEFKDFANVFEDIVHPGTPKDGSTVDITPDYYTTIAKGWRHQ